MALYIPDSIGPKFKQFAGVSERQSNLLTSVSLSDFSEDSPYAFFYGKAPCIWGGSGSTK